MSLKNKFEKGQFLIGVELTSSRGIVDEPKLQKTIELADKLIIDKDVDWISITDNAGGHPTLRPTTIGEKFLNKNKEIIIHLTCKDLNRNALESTAWSLASKGFNNILALTGDYPQKGYKGGSLPVFDLDSVTLLNLLSQMNKGLTAGIKKKTTLKSTNFFLGATVSNNKINENELIPQYLKLIEKIKNGADFIIPQVGFDSGKIQELKLFMKDNDLEHIPLIGNIYLLSKFTSNLFHKNKIPGIALTDELYDKCQKAAAADDKGKAFFIEFAAKMLNIFRKLGYNGAYFGGIHNYDDFKKIIEVERSYGENDYLDFIKELWHPKKDEFFLYEKDSDTMLLNHLKKPETKSNLSFKSKINYAFSKGFHRLMFKPGALAYKLGKAISNEEKYKYHLPSWIHLIEKRSKQIIYDCKDCGDCALQYTGYLCPESQCPKGLRNGPCGGTHDSICEVKDHTCIWARAYDRLKSDKKENRLLEHSPAFKDNSLKDTSAWANYWLGKDFGSKLINK